MTQADHAAAGRTLWWFSGRHMLLVTAGHAAAGQWFRMGTLWRARAAPKLWVAPQTGAYWFIYDWTIDSTRFAFSPWLHNTTECLFRYSVILLLSISSSSSCFCVIHFSLLCVCILLARRFFFFMSIDLHCFGLLAEVRVCNDSRHSAHSSATSVQQQIQNSKKTTRFGKRPLLLPLVFFIRFALLYFSKLVLFSRPHMY